MSSNTLLWILSLLFVTVSAYINVSARSLIPCRQDWFLFGDKCYKILGESEGLNWRQASVNCALERGHLATIHSEELQEYLSNFLLLNARTNAWIGLHDREWESLFTWEDGSDADYTNWDEKEPSETGPRAVQEDCVEMRFRDPKSEIGTWNDLPCDRQIPYFCQVNKSENTFSRDPRFCSLEEGEGWKYLNSCYHIITEKKSWIDAENYCKETFSGHLVTILDNKAQTYLNYILQNYQDNFWIGIKLKDQRVQLWSSGWHVIYKKWDHELTHFLENTCGMTSKKNLWTVGPCFRELPFICETSTNTALTLKKGREGWRCPDLSIEWLDLFGDHCYIFETNKTRNWNDANYECGRKGGILASIHSDVETLILEHHVRNKDKVYIGLHRSLSKKEIFEWADGSQLDYVNWGVGEPNSIREGCGEIWTESMAWNDVPCESLKGYICSAKKVPPKTIEKNESTSEECICTIPADTAKTFEHSSKAHACPRGISTGAIAGIIVSLLLVAFLVGFLVYRTRHVCKRQHEDVDSSRSGPASLSHISSEAILKPEKFECNVYSAVE